MENILVIPHILNLLIQKIPQAEIADCRMGNAEFLENQFINALRPFRNPKIRNLLMDSIVAIMQQIAARETERILTHELGIVTAIFPHEAEGDKNNYQCSVQLKNRKKANGADFELRQVPISTHHIGSAQIPNVGDLVIVAFIQGDLNAPVVIGRLYNEEQLPPVSKKEELVVNDIEVVKINMKDKKLSLEIDKDGNLTINAFKGGIIVKNDKVSLEMDKDGNVKMEAKGNISINDKQFVLKPDGSVSINDDQLTIKKGGEININKGDKGAAREGDDVEIMVPTGQIIVQVTGIGAPASNLALITLKGTIKSSSKTVKIG